LKRLLDNKITIFAELARKDENVTFEWKSHLPQDELAVFAAGAPYAAVPIGNFAALNGMASRPLYCVQQSAISYECHAATAANEATGSGIAEPSEVRSLTHDAITFSEVTNSAVPDRQYVETTDTFVKIYRLGAGSDRRLLARAVALEVLVGHRLSEAGVAPPILGTRVGEGYFGIVYRRLNGGDLVNFIKHSEVAARRRLAVRLAQKYSELRRHGIYWNDCRHHNVVFDDAAEPFFIDFELASVLELEDNRRRFLWIVWHLCHSEHGGLIPEAALPTRALPLIEENRDSGCPEWAQILDILTSPRPPERPSLPLRAEASLSGLPERKTAPMPGPRPGRKLVFLGDCQAFALAQVYREFVAPITEESVSFANAADAPSQAGMRSIEDADVVVAQVFDMERKLTAAGMRGDAEKVEFPAIFLGSLWPFGGQAPHPNNAPTARLAAGPYPAQLGDTFLNRLIAKGVAAEDALDRYLQLDVVRTAHLDRLMELHLGAQASRDARTGFGFARIIEARLRDTHLALTPHHPGLPLMAPLIWGVFERLGVAPSLIEAAMQALRVPPFPNHALPIHPAIIEHFGLSFVNKDSRYIYNHEGSFTFAEFVTRYINYTWNEELTEALALAQGADPARAHAALSHALQTSPESAAGWRSMSLVLRRMQRLDEARAAAERAASLDPSDPANAIELARVSLAAGDLRAAETEARHAVAVFPADGRAHSMLGEVHLWQGRRDEALLSAKRAVALRPADHALRGLLGHLVADQPVLGGCAGCGAKSAKPIESDPAVVGFRFLFAQQLFRQGRDEEAFQLARKLAGLGNPHAHALVGHILAKRADLEGAEAAFRAAVELQPSYGGFSDALASVRARITSRDIAAKGFQHLQEQMAGRPRFANRNELLAHVMKEPVIPGLVLEFGVYSGHTINIIADALPKRTIYGFDSFEGLPEAWGWAPAGHFARNSLPTVRKNVELIVGWFEDTLPGFVTDHPETDLSLLHVDCDLYSSTKTIFDHLGNRIIPGTIIVFDEYWNYPGWMEHEFKAFQEFTERAHVRYEFLGYTKYEQVALRIV
jgi:tetratricopeptide (TPR) repeat protein